MRARVHFETPTHSGKFEVDEPGETFTGWTQRVGAANAASGYFIGNKNAFQARYITMIEKLED